MQDVMAIWEEMDRRVKERDAWLRWSRDFRLGAPRERVLALREMTRALTRSLSLHTVLKAFGDPWTRILPRRGVAGRERREVLCYRHPTDARTQFQILVRDGAFSAMHFIVDEGACQAPRILDVEEYWNEGADGRDDGRGLAI